MASGAPLGPSAPSTGRTPSQDQRRIRARGGELVIDRLGVDYSSPGRRREVSSAIATASFSVAANAFISLIGPSGCGKSTLLKVVAGLIPATRGEVRLDGKRIGGPGPDRAVVFQAASLLPWRTILRNVAYGLELSGASKERRLARAREMLALVGLDAQADMYPHQLSGGMQQRANLARALAVEPRLLLLDEPFSALDAHTREQMGVELLRIWQELGNTAVLVTHQIDEAVLLSDRVVVFGPGPGSRILTSMEVHLARPRTEETRQDPEFARLVTELRALMKGARLETELRALMKGRASNAPTG